MSTSVLSATSFPDFPGPFILDISVSMLKEDRWLLIVSASLR